MAVAKLGALVTGLAGSIGGTTFRRGNNFLVVQNKPKGPSKSRLATNTVLTRNVQTIQAWTSLNTGTQNAWDDAALLYQFPDKFGDLKNLTGRQLYIKLTTQAQWAGFTVLPDPTALDSTLAEFLNESNEIETNGGVYCLADLILDISSAPSGCRIVYSLQFTGQGNRGFNLARFVAFDTFPVTVTPPDSEFVDIQSSLEDRFAVPVPGTRFAYAVYIVNPSGFKSVVQVARGTIQQGAC